MTIDDAQRLNSPACSASCAGRWNEEFDGTEKEKMMLRIVECEYPNPEYKYGIFYLGDHEIGRANKIEGGWVPNGKRKALPEEMAAKAMIDSAISKARRDEAHARKMLDALRMYCGGRLPPDGKVTPNAEVTGTP